MNISLTPELKHYVQEKVAGGMYTSASEVIRESLRLMHTYDDVQKKRMTELNQAIDLGMRQLYRKEWVNGPTSRERMKRKINALADTQDK